MPGSHGVLWPGDKRPARRRQPFSYVKACRTAEGLLLLATTIVVGFTDVDAGHSNFVVMACVAGEILIVMFILERLVWKSLPPRTRERIPYDSDEATQNKGDIRSFGQLMRLLTKRSE